MKSGVGSLHDSSCLPKMRIMHKAGVPAYTIGNLSLNSANTKKNWGEREPTRNLLLVLQTWNTTPTKLVSVFI